MDIQLMVTLDRSKYQGFTLIESLLVLMVVGVFISLPLLKVGSWRERVAYQAFIREFEQRLVQTQQSAIVTREKTRVVSIENGSTIQFIFFQRNNQSLKEELAIPKGVRVQRGTTLIFSPRTGNVEQAHTFRFETPYHQEYLEYVYQIGSGRYVIREA